MLTLRRIALRMLRVPNSHVTPPGLRVVDVVATVPAVSDVRDDQDASYYDRVRLLIPQYTGVSLYPTTLSWEERATMAARDAASKLVELTPTMSWEDRATMAARDAASKLVELTPWDVEEDQTPLEQNVTIEDVATVPAVGDFDDDDYLSEGADDNDEVAAQDDELVKEEPVAIVMIVAPPPLRRSKRIALQQCKALRSAVAPSPYAITSLRRSARLAGKPRVNYKY